MLTLFHFKSLPLKKQQLLGPLTLGLLASLLAVFNAEIEASTLYHYALIEQGQVWRLVTGHFLHTNIQHYLLNMAGLILLWALHGQFYTPASYLKLALFCSLFTSISMFCFYPNMHEYVGLSGVLHGILAWGICKDIYAKDKTGYILLLGVIIKLAHEQIYGASAEMEQLISAPVAIDAHLYGAIAGATYFFINHFVLKNTNSQ